MSENTDIKLEAKRLRLLAAVLELQHYTSTEANVLPIPGGDRVIAIGTPAQVRGLLPKQPMPPELQAAIAEAAQTRAAGAVLPDGSAVFINYGEQPADTAHMDCMACGGSGHIDDLIPAARDVLDERRRQVEAEGWVSAMDDQYVRHELSLAAACYLLAGDGPHEEAPANWPWEPFWWKPAGDRRNLVKAGALILAEIERLDRAAVGAEQVDSEGGHHD